MTLLCHSTSLLRLGTLSCIVSPVMEKGLEKEIQQNNKSLDLKLNNTHNDAKQSLCWDLSIPIHYATTDKQPWKEEHSEITTDKLRK